jgi:hypothetical protein
VDLVTDAAEEVDSVIDEADSVEAQEVDSEVDGVVSVEAEVLLVVLLEADLNQLLLQERKPLLMNRLPSV